MMSENNNQFVFGHGLVLINVCSFTLAGSVGLGVLLTRTETPHPIGTVDNTPPYTLDGIPECGVALRFDNVESLDVLVEALFECRRNLVQRDSCKTRHTHLVEFDALGVPKTAKIESALRGDSQ